MAHSTRLARPRRLRVPSQINPEGRSAHVLRIALRFGTLLAGIWSGSCLAAHAPVPPRRMKSPSPSTAPREPGAIPPELYRPIPGSGVPECHVGARLRDGAARPRPTARNGRSTIKFTDVAALIDPTTVTFTSLSEPRTRVLEQNFQFDLVSTDKLLLKYIDRPITVERAVGNQASTVSGTLLSSVDGLVLQGQRRQHSRAAGLFLGALPGAARRAQHEAHAGVGHPLAARRRAAHARHLSDGRRHLVGRLQPDLQRGQGREQRRARSVRLGQHHQPVRRHLRRRAAQADRRRRAPRRATGSRRPR